MKLALFTTACVVAAAALPLSTRASGTANNWTYKAGDKKEVGPPKWGKAYPTCAGKKQSPIDITDVTDAETTLPLEFGGSCSEYNVTQHYDAFKAEVQGGSCAVQYANKSFSFAQVHFHAPSEHTISGEHFDAEAHFVHLSKDGQAVVVGVFLQRSDEERDDDDSSDDSKEERASGDDSSEDSEEERASAYGAGQSTSAAEPFFAQFLEALAKVKEDVSVPATLGSFHAGVQELFSEGNVFNYPGGLTTPPCSEIVTWFVLETPITISHKEYESITESLKRIEAAKDGENARPTQPLNGREVLSY